LDLVLGLVHFNRDFRNVDVRCGECGAHSRVRRGDDLFRTDSATCAGAASTATMAGVGLPLRGLLLSDINGS
jgi:hypothetical protein